jgi:hypothetical protein
MKVPTANPLFSFFFFFPFSVDLTLLATVPSLQLDQDFEGMDNSELLKLSNWVHHYPHILQQGRCLFASTKQVKEDDEEDEEAEEEQGEQGPKLLREISEDAGKSSSVFLSWFCSSFSFF